MILKLIMWFLRSLTQVATLLVLLITPTLQLVFTPGIVIGGLLDFIASTFSTIGEYVVRIIFYIVASVISAFFKFLSTIVRGFFGLIFSAIMGMMHLPKGRIVDLSGLIPGSFGGLSENGNKLVLLGIIIIILWVLS